MRTHSFLSALLLILILASQALAQQEKISRIEFNSGTRTFRQQIIITPDSAISVEEDFRINLKPITSAKKLKEGEWKTILHCLEGVKLSEIDALKSPTDKRTYDAAAHGSIIITTENNKTYTHGFDDEEPHAKLKPLMRQILQYKKKK
jgi:hypothetical protein